MRTAPMKLLAAALLTLAVAACRTDSVVTSGAECSQWRSITWSVKDTTQTRDEVKGSNARRKSWCKG
jgi:hypothetical protein